MKALSVLQPWAWLLAHGHKDIENRVWRSNFAGEFVIHAGKRWDSENKADLLHVRAAFPHIELPHSFDLGGIVGRAVARPSVSCSNSAWFSGPLGIPVVGARPLRFTRLRGQLGWFEIPDDLIAALDLPVIETVSGDLFGEMPQGP